MLSKHFFAWLILLSCAVPNLLPAQEIVFSTEPSSKKLGLKDQFQVSFVLTNGSNISDFQPPSFNGFQVLSGPLQSSQRNISIINGHTKESSTIRLSYILQPKEKGELTIDGASIKINGRSYSSNPITIQVVSGGIASHQPGRQRGTDPFANDPAFQAMRRQQQQMQQMIQQQLQQMGQSPPPMIDRKDLSGLDEKSLNKNVFIKVSVDNTHPYVGQQITTNYKLYTRLPMSMNLTQLPSLNGFWSEDFDIPNPPKPTVEKINGKTYQVFLLKKSALFPQNTGKLTLDPAKAEGTVRVIEKSDNQSPLANNPNFGSLSMNSPFFNNGYFSQYQYKDVHTTLSSAPITINVQPLPTADQPKSFTGAVGKFSIQATIDSTTLTTGNYANLTLTIKGSGNFKIFGNPTVNFPPSLNALDPFVTDTITSRRPEISGEKTLTYNLSPQQAGKFTIPSVAFSYFDPISKTYKTLHTQPITLTIKSGSGNLAANNALANNLPLDIHPNRKQPRAWMSGLPFLFVTGPWYWTLYLIGLVAFLVAWYLYKRKAKIEANAVLWRNKKANKVAWKRLSTARKLLPKKGAAAAFYEEVSKAVWLYLSDKLNIPISQLSKDNISGKLLNEGFNDSQIIEVQDLLSECELALYSPSGGKQQRNQTLDNATNCIGSLENILNKRKKINLHDIS